MQFNLFMYCTVGRRAELEAGMAGQRNELYQRMLDEIAEYAAYRYVQTVCYRQPLRRTTLKTPLGIPASPTDDVGCPNMQPQPDTATRSKAWCGNARAGQAAQDSVGLRLRGFSGQGPGDGPFAKAEGGQFFSRGNRCTFILT
jgi:hypothetical protein